MSFTEFCCRSSGSNMNGGGDHTNGEPGTSALYSATNGGWNSGTGVFTPTSGNPSLTVTAGDWANVFNDGSTTPVFIGRVTSVNSTTITVSTSAIAGTAPTTSATGRSINVGGAWLGPSGAIAFPFNFVTNTLTDASGNMPRINFKNNQTYNITAAISHTNVGPIRFQGYTTTFNDLGKATIDGGTSGTSYVLLSLSGGGGAYSMVFDFIFQNNGASGSANGIFGSDPRCFWSRCVINSVRGSGADAGFYFECETYACNQNNSSTAGGIANVTGAQLFCLRCVSHDNAGNSSGFYTQAQGSTFTDCIAANNGNKGFYINNAGITVFTNCDAFNNTSDGFFNAGVDTPVRMENCNAISNGGYGINFAASPTFGVIINCGFYNNTSGQTSAATGTMEITGSVTYASSPYANGSNGDFRITLAAAKNAGNGLFTETTGTPGTFTGTIGYPDIGAAQHLDAATGPIGQLKEFARGTPF